MIVCPFSSGDISREVREEWSIKIKVSRILWFASLERCSWRRTDSQGAEGVVRAGLEDKGQKVSKQYIRLEQNVSVALLASRYDNSLRGGSEDETIADSREGESERKLCRKVTCGGVCDVSGIMLRLRVRRKWSPRSVQWIYIYIYIYINHYKSCFAYCLQQEISFFYFFIIKFVRFFIYLIVPAYFLYIDI